MPLNVCAIFRNEAPYLAEWIEFHRLVGVERFYFYQNNSEDDWEPVLRPYVQQGVIEVQQWPVEAPSQLPAFRHHIGRHRGERGWTAFLDCDEFLFSPIHQTVTEVLNNARFDNCGAIGVNWMCFGSGGEERRTEGPVIERFVFRPPDDFGANANFKSIIRMDRIEGVGGDAHFFRVRGGTWTDAGDLITAPLVAPPRHELLRINHYVTKSREEWLKRIAHGRVDMPCRRDPTEFEMYQSQDVHDTTIWRFLPELKRRLRF